MRLPSSQWAIAITTATKKRSQQEYIADYCDRQPTESFWLLHYEKVTNSEELKGIDLDLLLRCINMVNHVDAIKTFQQALVK